ncbi:MAG TPA: Gfo/Idh/MocA family oxidoreductase, partial [Bacteroidetes bacterium]|nr:Gfo/Idh/MocA family oxidoreductase [Bacteroidota bacterium]
MMLGSEHVSEERKKMVKLGQIGVGNWGKNLLRNFANLPDAELVAVSDISEEVLQKVGRQYPGVQLFSRAEELIDLPEVEAVVIATEPVTHFPLAKRALEQGKHVFVEK